MIYSESATTLGTTWSEANYWAIHRGDCQRCLSRSKHENESSRKRFCVICDPILVARWQKTRWVCFPIANEQNKCSNESFHACISRVEFINLPRIRYAGDCVEIWAIGNEKLTDPDAINLQRVCKKPPCHHLKFFAGFSIIVLFFDLSSRELFGDLKIY